MRATRTIRKAEAGQVAPGEAVAVIDCGTSSVRAYLAEVSEAGGRVLEELAFPVDLTPGFTGGKLDREAMDRVVHAMVGIREASRAYGITRLRAVATSALREANNSDVLVERVRSAAGFDVEIIDGPEVARLYFLALQQLLQRNQRSLPGNTLLLDIGAGSTCVSLLRGGKLVHSVDEHFGSVRTWDLFQDLKDSTDFAITVDRFSIGAARMLLARLPSHTVTNLLVTGSEVRRLAELLSGDGTDLEPLDLVRLDRWLHEMEPLTPRQRAEHCRVADAFEAARLLPPASLIRHLGQTVEADRVLVPHFTLRDGLLADLLPGAHGAHHLDDDHLLAEARQLVVRYGGNLPYCENTAELAVQIFNQTRELHGLGDRERLLLHFSALVHDVGSFINVRNRHKHTMYIVQAADIAGLTRAEQDMVANVARYHRKSPPEPHHAEFMALERRHRVIVAYLAAILRLAYGLDVERSQRIRRVRCRVDGRRMLLHVDRRQIALERWSIAGKASLFREVFGLDVAVVPRGQDA